MSDPYGRNERPVVIFGAGQLAIQALHYLCEASRDVHAFAVDHRFLVATSTLCDLPVVAVSSLPKLYPPHGCEMFIAVGYRRMRARREAYERMQAAGYRFVNVVSSQAVVDSRAELGDNNLIFPGCIIESNVSIGSNNVFWSGTTVCHDSRVGNHNFLAPRTVIAGNCSVQDLCFFGVGSICIDGLHVRSETYLRAGAVLLSDSEQLGKYGGNPAVKLGAFDSRKGIQIGRALELPPP